MKRFEARLRPEQPQFRFGDKQPRQLRKRIPAIRENEPIDMVDMRVGEGNRSNPLRRDLRLGQGLRKQPHARAPRVRSARVDQTDRFPVIQSKSVHRKPQLSLDKGYLRRQVSLEYCVLRLAQSRDRHIDIAITQRGQSESPELVGDMMIARGNAFQAFPFQRPTTSDGAERASEQAAAGRFAWAVPLLRGDRENRRRPENGNQGAARGVNRVTLRTLAWKRVSDDDGSPGQSRPMGLSLLEQSGYG